jgi:hypothetical protein
MERRSGGWAGCRLVCFASVGAYGCVSSSALSVPGLSQPRQILHSGGVSESFLVALGLDHARLIAADPDTHYWCARVGGCGG